MQTSLRTQSGGIADFNIEFFNTIGQYKKYQTVLRFQPSRLYYNVPTNLSVTVNLIIGKGA